LGTDTNGTDIEVKIFYLLNFDVAGQAGKVDRKIGAFHLAGQGADQSLAGAFAA